MQNIRSKIITRKSRTSFISGF